MTTATPFARPLYVMLKPAGARCNLACKYCYYLEKKNLYAGSPRHVIDDDTLELFTRQYIEAQTSPDVLFTWHGGEPLLGGGGGGSRCCARCRSTAVPWSCSTATGAAAA